MASKSPVRVIIEDTQFGRLRALVQPRHPGEPATQVKVPAGAKVELLDTATQNGPTRLQARRVGKHLHVAFEGGNIDQPDLVLEDYYDDRAAARLVGKNSSGQVVDYFPANGAQGEALAGIPNSLTTVQVLDSAVAAALPGAGAGLLAGINPWLLGGLGVLGVGAALSSGGSSGPTTPAPATPAGNLSVASDSGAAANDNLTRVNTPTFTGSGTAGDTITVTVAGQTLTTTVAANGTWSVTVPAASPLPNGNHAVSITATNAGGTSAPASVNIVVDTVAPALTGALATASDTGTSNSDSITRDSTPTISGTSEPGAVVQVVIGGQTLTTTAAADGSWSVTATVLAEGPHTATITATDAAGNTTTLQRSLVIDTLAPAASGAVLAAPDLVSTSDSGNSDTDDITRDTTPTVSVSAPGAGETLILLVNGQPVASTYDAATGTLTPTTALAPGVYALSYAISDVAGNTSTTSPSLTVTVDNVAPTDLAAPDLVAASDSGSSNTDNTTRVPTPAFAVTAPPAGSSITLYVDGVATAATYDSTAGTLTPNVALAQGAHNITYTHTDVAGNESAPAGPLAMTLDTTAPAAPTVALDMTADTDSGVNTDNITQDATPSFAVTAPPAGQSLQLLVDGAARAATYDAGAGTLTPTGGLTGGPHDVRYALVDLAGNASATSPILAIEIIGGAPPAPAALDLVAASDSGVSDSDNLTRFTTPAFAVAPPSAGSSLRLYRDGVAVAATFDAGASTLTPTTAWATGTYGVTYSVVDVANNESGQSAALAVTIDTLAPATPTAPDLTAATDSGSSNTDNLTRITTPAFAVAPPPAGGSLTLLIDDAEVPSTYDAGTSTVTALNALPDGPYSVSYRHTDAAGNPSLASPSLAIQVLNAAPALTASSPADDASGVVPSGSLSLTYSSPVVAGAGGQTLSLLRADGSVHEQFNVTTGVGSDGGTLGIAGNTVTLNLGTPTAPSSSYHVQVQAGAVLDAAGNSAPAISDTITLNFSTAVLAEVMVSNLALTTYSQYLHTINPNLANSNTLMYRPGTTDFGTEMFSGVAQPDDNGEPMSVTPAFADGINWFGTTYNQIGVNVNGHVSFGHVNTTPTTLFLDNGIQGYPNGGVIATQFDDFQIDKVAVAQSPLGNSLGTNELYYAAYQYGGSGVVVATWDDVSSYQQVHTTYTDGLTNNDYTTGNAYQIRLVETGDGQTVIQLVYENVAWIVGTASEQNSEKPSAGWSKGDGITFAEVQGNVDGAAVTGITGSRAFLDVELTSNVGIPGVWEWFIGESGDVGAGSIPLLDVHNTTAGALDAVRLQVTNGAATIAQDPANWDARFTLGSVSATEYKVQSVAGAVFDPSESAVEMRVLVTDTASGDIYPRKVIVNLFDQMGNVGDNLIGIRDQAFDVAKITDAESGMRVIDGEGGIDTLVFTGSNLSLDMREAESTAVINVERVNLGTGGNTLTLTRGDLIDMSNADQFNAGNEWVGLGASVAADQLVVDGAAGSMLNVANSAQWTTTSAGTVSNGGQTYAIYNAIGGTAQLLVDTDVTINFGP